MLIALSLFIPYILGLGLFACMIVPRLLGELPETRHDCARLLTILLLGGISLNYILVLLLQGLTVSLVLGSTLSLAGFAYLFFRVRRRFFSIFKLGWVGWLVVCCFLLLYALPVLFAPIKDWDARSIWFFHGKIIFYKDGLYLANIAKETSTSFSHLDYPPLLPILAAEFAHIEGYWNELFPKASLLVLLIPLLLGIFSFASRARLGAVYFLPICLFIPGNMLWNGYMDGYLALFGAVALLFWGRWITSHHPCDFLAGALFLMVSASLKNEGVLLVISVTCSLALTSLFSRDRATQLTHFYQALHFLPLVALPLCDLIVWGRMKAFWGFENDLALGLGSIPRIMARVAEGKIMTIGHSLLIDANVGRALLLLLCGLVLAKILRIRTDVAIWFAFLSAFLYFAGIFLVYLATPAELTLHLETSASRTMQTVVLGLFAATFFTIRSMEEAQSLGIADRRDGLPGSGQLHI